MANVKVPNVDEVVRWIKDGKTYYWIMDALEEKYGVRVGYSTIVDIRRRHGIPPRLNRHDELIPWQVKLEHRHAFAPKMLRALGRRRAGKSIAVSTAQELDAWLVARNESSPEAPEGTVVHYEPDTEQGWFYVPRRPGIDTDMIRVPDEDAVTRARKPRAR